MAPGASWLQLPLRLPAHMHLAEPTHSLRVARPLADRNYYSCWTGLKSHFDPAWTPEKAAAAAAAGGGGGDLQQQQQQRQLQHNGAAQAEA